MAELSFVHRFVPAGDVAHAQTLLLLHGTGGDEDDLLSLGKELHPMANLLSPRGKVSENGMNRFFKRFADGTFDVDDLKRRTQELAEFIQEATSAYHFDPSRLTVVGYSNGANTGASLLFVYPEILAGAILLRATLPFEPDTVAALKGKPVLILGGTEDSMIPQAGTKRLADILRENGAAVTLEWQTTGHRLTENDVKIAAFFLKKHAGAQE
jgi:phospholipase/carboxylesterase